MHAAAVAFRSSGAAKKLWKTCCHSNRSQLHTSSRWACQTSPYSSDCSFDVDFISESCKFNHTSTACMQLLWHFEALVLPKNCERPVVLQINLNYIPRVDELARRVPTLMHSSPQPFCKIRSAFTIASCHDLAGSVLSSQAVDKKHNRMRRAANQKAWHTKQQQQMSQTICKKCDESNAILD